MDQFHSLLLSLQFKLRNRFLGRMPLRRGSPKLSSRSQDRALYAALLQSIFREPTQQFEWIWDIGCRNWSYVESLTETFPNAKLIGVELDGNRRYWNLYRRRDVAQAYAQKIRKTKRWAECHFSDFRAMRVGEWSGKTNLFCFFFPFVSIRPCLKWGLPKEYADFSELLSHAKMLSPNLVNIISFHQGPWEAELARKAYTQQRMKIREIILDQKSLNGLWVYPFAIHGISATSTF